jgi:hypothetical protein
MPVTAMPDGLSKIQGAGAALCGAAPEGGAAAAAVAESSSAAEAAPAEPEPEPEPELDSDEGVSLQQRFIATEELVRQVRNSELASNDPTQQGRVKKALLGLRRCAAMVRAGSVFSANEEADDIKTSDLKLLLIPHYTAEMTLLQGTPGGAVRAASHPRAHPSAALALLLLPLHCPRCSSRVQAKDVCAVVSMCAPIDTGVFVYVHVCGTPRWSVCRCLRRPSRSGASSSASVSRRSWCVRPACLRHPLSSVGSNTLSSHAVYSCSPSPVYAWR